MDEFIHDVKEQLISQYGDILTSPSWYEIIDWKEPFIISIIFFQVLLFTFVCTTFRYEKCQWFSFLLIVGLLFSMEHWNKVGKIHWNSFATQNYFDAHGVFMMLFIAGPLFITGFLQVACTIYRTSHLLVDVKRAELIDFHNQKKKNK